MRHDPVNLRAIAARLVVSPATVADWASPYRRARARLPFPPPRWGGPRSRLWDWPIIEAWYEAAHRRRPA